MHCLLHSFPHILFNFPNLNAILLNINYLFHIAIRKAKMKWNGQTTQLTNSLTFFDKERERWSVCGDSVRGGDMAGHSVQWRGRKKREIAQEQGGDFSIECILQIISKNSIISEFLIIKI